MLLIKSIVTYSRLRPVYHRVRSNGGSGEIGMNLSDRGLLPLIFPQNICNCYIILSRYSWYDRRAVSRKFRDAGSI